MKSSHLLSDSIDSVGAKREAARAGPLGLGLGADRDSDLGAPSNSSLGHLLGEAQAATCRPARHRDRPGQRVDPVDQRAADRGARGSNRPPAVIARQFDKADRPGSGRELRPCWH